MSLRQVFTDHGSLSCGPHGFREDFKVFPIISLWKLLTPRVGPVWNPGTWLAGFM